MKRILLLACAGFLFIVSFAQSTDERAIQKVMADQVEAWNRGSIDDFMKGYWKDDSLIFIGKSGINYGYDKALANYKSGYSDTVKMGQLQFTLLSLKRLSPDHFLVIGKWFLKRKIGDIGGIYSLVFRKIGEHWVIIADHTS
jgi:ketosteroid isomerase-like protein